MEIWKPLVDEFWGKYYHVSNTGRIKSLQRKIERGGVNNKYVWYKPETIKKPGNNKIHEHLFVHLSVRIDGKQYTKSAYIHKEVALAFLKRPSKRHIYVTHIDGNYKNNLVSNLKWITASQNSKRSMVLYPQNRFKIKETNTKSGYYDSIRSEAKKNPDKVFELYQNGETKEEIAEKFKCSVSTINKILNVQPINSTGGAMEMLNRHQLDNALKQEGFILGTNSDAAKELWFNSKEFQIEKIKSQIKVLKSIDVPMESYITIQIYGKISLLRQQIKELENE